MPNTMADIQTRLTELEMRFAFQDDVVGVLNPQVAAQERRLVDVVDELRQLRREVALLRAALGHHVADEPPPPHY